MRIARTLFGIAVFLIAVSAVSAQTGGLEVQVVDANGPLPGATVTISHNAGNIAASSALTDAKGFTAFPVLRPGSGYSIEVSFPGFGTRRVPNIRVPAGGKEKLTVQLAEEMTERVKVIAEGEVVDLEKTATSNKFSDDFIQDLPVPGRFYQNVLTLAPGVQDSDGDGNPNVHGSRDRDFKTVVSGISNVDPLTGGFMSQVNPNSIEEMEVITAGAGAEFSRAQGGFARILQKQGSNEFEGVAEFYFRSSLLDGDGAADLSAVEDPGFDWYQPSFNVSGPIIKDKLWYRLSHEFIDQEIPVNVGSSLAITTVTQGIHSDQLTWQASPRNKLALQLQSDPLEINGLGLDSLTPLESTRRRDRTGETYSLTWTAPFSPKILIESQVGWQDLNSGFFPTTSGIPNNCVEGAGFEFLSDAQCFNIDTGVTSGSHARFHDDHRQRLTVRGDATVYGGRFWGMNHQFKMGVATENERYFRSIVRRPEMSIFIFEQTDDSDPNADPKPIAIINSTVSVPAEDEVTATGTNWGFYVEDQIKPAQNLTITLGARIDREEINSEGTSPLDPETESLNFLELQKTTITPLALQESFTGYEGLDDFVVELSQVLGVPQNAVKQNLSTSARDSVGWHQKRRKSNINLVNTNFSPRLAVAWDPWSDGKTKIVAAGGRYYDKVFLAVPLIELEPVTTSIVFNAEPNNQGGFTVTGLRASVNPAVNVFSVDQNLQTPYNDEITLQVEREIFAESSLRLTYVKRKFRDQLQDTDINRIPADLGHCLLPQLGGSSAVLAPSPGMGQMLIDPYTGLEYMDTDPGDGDGFVAPGMSEPFDDCGGDVIIPRNQGNQDDPFSRDKRIERRDGFADLYLQNPGFGDVFQVGNFNKIDYEGWVLEFIRRQFRSWEMQVSYTFSEAVGDGEDFDQTLGDDQSLLQDQKGYQSYDQRHVVKVNTTTITPWGFRLGMAVQWQSGQPYSLIERNISFDQVPPSYGSIASPNGSRVRLLYDNGQRNTERNTSWWDVDVKFTKEMNLGSGMNMQVSAEIFNLFNDDTLFVFDQFNGNNASVRNFGRQWQLGARLAF